MVTLDIGLLHEIVVMVSVGCRDYCFELEGLGMTKRDVGPSFPGTYQHLNTRGQQDRPLDFTCDI
jgi:hypothetical protein